MTEYGINKGIGKQVEFRGLKSQYLFIFAGGLLAVFILFVVMYMAGAPQLLCIIFGICSASSLVWVTFYLNAKYGSYGLLKIGATKKHPRRIINRRRVASIMKRW